MSENFPVVRNYFVATWCRLGFRDCLKLPSYFDSGFISKERSVMYLGLHGVNKGLGPMGE
jgi:hypothetical protein